jgi:hypothetical protein
MMKSFSPDDHLDLPTDLLGNYNPSNDEVELIKLVKDKRDKCDRARDRFTRLWDMLRLYIRGDQLL